MAGPISAAKRLVKTALKIRRSIRDIMSDLTGPGIEAKTSRTESNVFNHYTNRLGSTSLELSQNLWPAETVTLDVS